MKSSPWNKKVAKNRGDGWRKKLVSGRLEAQMNPSALRLRRIKLNKTQSEMAKEAGLCAGTYGAIENGHRKVNKNNAEKIAKILREDFDAIFSPSKMPNRYNVIIPSRD